MGGGQDLIDHKIDIGRATVGVFRREGVKAEEGRADAHPARLLEAPGDAQHTQFALGIEAIARLDLEGGDAAGDQGLQPIQRPFGQGRVAGLAGRADRRGDAAPLPRDLRIGHAGQAAFVLARAVAAEHQMGVAVDQAGRDPAAVQPVNLCSPMVRQLFS